MLTENARDILDGKKLAKEVRSRLKEKVSAEVKKGHRAPGLAVMLIGEDPASQVYVKNKIAACKKVGITSSFHEFPADVSEAEVLAALESLNIDPGVDGILVQLPLPEHLSVDRILNAIRPDKDADGLAPYNLGLLLSGKPGPRPCTPKGIMALLDQYEVPLEGRNAVVVGRSNLVGKPISLMLQQRHATVTMCHSRTRNLPEVCRQADVLVVAVGKEELVKGDWVKPGAVVVDVGIHRRELPDGRSELAGDVCFDEVSKTASLVTPVPGGVGPMTVAMLLENTFEAYQNHLGDS